MSERYAHEGGRPNNDRAAGPGGGEFDAGDLDEAVADDAFADDLDDDLLVVDPTPPQTHDGIPIRGCHTVATQADVIAAGILMGEPLLEDGSRRAQAPPVPPRMPAGDPPTRGSSRQVNFRLGPNEHARLREAAPLFGMRPTALARVLTVRGVDRALYEERRDR